MIVGLIALLAFSLMVMSLPIRPANAPSRTDGIAMTILGPLQKAFTASIRYIETVWSRYFYLVQTAKENEKLREELGRMIEENNCYQEAVLSNERFRRLLDLKSTLPHQMVASEVIGKDPSPWFKTIIVDKGSRVGVATGMAVLVPDGVVGQVIEVANEYAKVLLLVDQNSAVDTLVQRTRARGIVKGGVIGKCIFDYALRKDDIRVGDTIITSGVDGVFPKGLRVGEVSEIVKRNAGIFQEVVISPFVDFEKIEEVFIIVHHLKSEK